MAVVAGAAGGLGSALLDALRDDDDYQVAVAISRAPRPQETRASAWYQAESYSPAALDEVAERLAGEHTHIHLLISCMGVLHGGPGDPDFKPEKALGELRLENLHRAMEINAFAPLATLRAFARLLRHEERSVAAVLSAMVGSTTDNRLGGWYSYRMSKAALNMGMRNAAIELGRLPAGPIVAAIHPGTTLTGLSEPYVRRHKHSPPEVSAGRILNVLGKLRPEDSGRFFNWDGTELPF